MRALCALQPLQYAVVSRLLVQTGCTRCDILSELLAALNLNHPDPLLRMLLLHS
jgi:hypothetical protein